MTQKAIVADIGGTNARFAWVTVGSADLQSLCVYPCKDFGSLADATKQYMQDYLAGEAVSTVSIAIAGPITQDWVHLPNSHWSFSQSELTQQLGLQVNVINDFTAQALAINTFSQADLRLIGEAPLKQTGSYRAILGPGTGLGVAALSSSGEVVPSEGGHIAFAPSNAHEAQLLTALWQKHPRISCERMLSGMGLENLYWANASLTGQNLHLSASEITANAHEGDALCLQAIDDFHNILGSTAGDLALMFGATDGVYISGGVIAHTQPFLDEAALRERFEQKGRFSNLMKTISLAIVCAEQPGLAGCTQAV